MARALSEWMAERNHPEFEAAEPPAPDTDRAAARVEPEAIPSHAAQQQAEPDPRPEMETDAQKNPLSGNSSTPISMPTTNYYELLQISPNADLDTIQRVYRFMAMRFHPDNPNTGNNERFLLLKEAMEVLVDPARRAEYDTANRSREAAPMPIFEEKGFLDGLEGEMNRRFGILSLLYYRRRISGATPGLSVLELEKRMAFPREHLEFTLWYLTAKGYIALTDCGSDYALTSAGVDYVEKHSASSRVVRQLLAPNRGEGLASEPAARASGTATWRRRFQRALGSRPAGPRRSFRASKSRPERRIEC